MIFQPEGEYSGLMIESYKGIQIEISTVETEAKSWASRAEYKIEGNSPVLLVLDDAQYSTEVEAQQAALQAAIESIDRSRTSKGKR